MVSKTLYEDMGLDEFVSMSKDIVEKNLAKYGDDQDAIDDMCNVWLSTLTSMAVDFGLSVMDINKDDLKMFFVNSIDIVESNKNVRAN